MIYFYNDDDNYHVISTDENGVGYIGSFKTHLYINILSNLHYLRAYKDITCEGGVQLAIILITGILQ
jgi:hypothetical protein